MWEAYRAIRPKLEDGVFVRSLISQPYATHTHTHTHTNTSTHTRRQAHSHVRTPTRICKVLGAGIWVSQVGGDGGGTHAHTNTHARISTCISIYRSYGYICTHTERETHTHTNTSTHTSIHKRLHTHAHNRTYEPRTCEVLGAGIGVSLVGGDGGGLRDLHRTLKAGEARVEGLKSQTQFPALRKLQERSAHILCNAKCVLECAWACVHEPIGSPPPPPPPPEKKNFDSG